jgi:hypothetical protein
MLHPLLVCDGEIGQLITAVLRPGHTHGRCGVNAVLKQAARTWRARWPDGRIKSGMDSAGAVRELSEWCDATGVTYTIRLITNPRLTALAVPRSPRRNGSAPAGASTGVPGRGDALAG